MKKIFIVLMILPVLAMASVADLEEFVNNLKQQSISVAPQALPVYNLSNTKYSAFSWQNIFNQKRLNLSESDNYLHSYNLNQLRLVGYMRYNNIDYAFIQTPFETLCVKSGDKILSAVVEKISSDSVEIVNEQKEGSTNFTNKILLQLNQPIVAKLPKLQ